MLFPNHHKIWSWLLLWRLRLPTLQGIIISDWSSRAEDLVEEFAASLNVDALLVRSDKAPETGDYPPAGNVVALNDIRESSIHFLQRGRVVFLLEPRSRFDDLYSLSIGFRGRAQASVEIVGPGFDASDLKRGDTSPHEWFDVTFGAQGPAITNRGVVSPRAYRRSWGQRLSKIGRLVAGDHPESKRPTAADSRVAVAWLTQHNFSLLLENRKQYLPIPPDLLAGTLRQCASLPARLGEFGAEDDVFVVSLSFIGRSADQVYWDIVWPRTKFDVPRSARSGAANSRLAPPSTAR